MYQNRMLNLYFYFLQFLPKIQSCEKSVKYKSSEEQPKLTNYVNCFFAILYHCQDFLRKLPKLVVIRNACIVYFLNFGKEFSTLLKYLFSHLKQPCCSLFNELSQSTVVISDLLIFTSPLGIL